MDYIKKEGKTVIERYSVNSYTVDKTNECINVILWHSYIDKKGNLKQESIAKILDNKTGYVIDPDFEFTKESFEKLMSSMPKGFDVYNPSTWGTINLPKVEVPEKKYYSIVVAENAATMDKKILECLVAKGELPSGTGWRYK